MGDTIADIHHRSGGSYGIRRVRPSLLNDFDMIVNRKLDRSLMREPGLVGLPRPRREPRTSQTFTRPLTSLNASSPRMHPTCCGPLISPNIPPAMVKPTAAR
ncbi:transposase [Gordonia sputi]